MKYKPLNTILWLGICLMKYKPIGDIFFVVFHVFENSCLSREVYVDFGLVTTVNDGSTQIPGKSI